MRRMSGWGWVLGGAVLALVVPARPAGTEEPAKPKLTGRWQLNEKQSEDARAKLEDMRGRGGPSGGGMGGRPGGGGMGGRPGGGGMGGPPGGRGMGGRPAGDRGDGSRMRALLHPPQTLTISGNDAELALDDGEGVLVLLHADGRKYKQEGGNLEIKTEWKGSQLVVESKPAGGRGKVTTAYSLRPQTGQLQVDTRLDGPMGDPVTIRRVYEQVPME